MNATTLKIALTAATALALSVVACSSADVPQGDEGNAPAVETGEGTTPSRFTGAVAGTSGGVVKVNPGTNNPPTPVANCPGTCERASDPRYCVCPHGFTSTSAYVCVPGYRFLCFNGRCACYL